MEYIGYQPLQSFKARYSQIGNKNIHIHIQGGKVSSARRHITVRASQVLFLHLEKKFPLLPEHVATRFSPFTGHAISSELPSWNAQEYDTTRILSSLKFLPPLSPCPYRYKVPMKAMLGAARVQVQVKKTILIARKSSSSTSCCGKTTRIGWTGATESGAPMKSHALHWRMIVREPNQPIYRGCKTNRTQLVTLTTKGSQAHMSRLSLTVKDM